MIKKIFLLILLLCSPVYGQWQNGLKPLLGQQIDWSNPLSKGLVGYWLMNEGSGNTVQDLSGNGRHGTFLGTNTTLATGKFGPCLNFNGTADRVAYPAFDSGPAISISAWIMSNAWDSDDVILSQMRTVFAVRGGGASLYFYPDADEAPISYTHTFTVGQWYHVAVSFSAAQDYIMAIDGVVVASGTSGSDLDRVAAGSGIGTLVSTSWPFKGNIDNLLFYNRALSAGEIADLYRTPFGIIQPTFSVWWYSGIGGEPPATFGQVIMISN